MDRLESRVVLVGKRGPWTNDTGVVTPCPPGGLRRGDYLCGLHLPEEECPMCERYICPECGGTYSWDFGGTDGPECDDCWYEKWRNSSEVSEGAT